MNIRIIDRDRFTVVLSRVAIDSAFNFFSLIQKFTTYLSVVKVTDESRLELECTLLHASNLQTHCTFILTNSIHKIVDPPSQVGRQLLAPLYTISPQQKRAHNRERGLRARLSTSPWRPPLPCVGHAFKAVLTTILIKSAVFYSLTLQPPSAVTHAILGQFAEREKTQQILTASGSRLTLYRPDASQGKIATIMSHDVFGIIRSLSAFRLAGTNKGTTVTSTPTLRRDSDTKKQSKPSYVLLCTSRLHSGGLLEETDHAECGHAG